MEGERAELLLSRNAGIRIDRLTDRVRQRFERPRCAVRPDEVEKEQRISARTAGDLLDFVRKQRRLLRREIDDLLQLLQAQRVQRDKEAFPIKPFRDFQDPAVLLM